MNFPNIPSNRNVQLVDEAVEEADREVVDVEVPGEVLMSSWNLIAIQESSSPKARNTSSSPVISSREKQYMERNGYPSKAPKARRRNIASGTPLGASWLQVSLAGSTTYGSPRERRFSILALLAAHQSVMLLTSLARYV